MLESLNIPLTSKASAAATEKEQVYKHPEHLTKSFDLDAYSLQ